MDIDNGFNKTNPCCAEDVETMFEELWIKNANGQIQFKGGKQDWAQTVEIAVFCRYFSLDYDDELAADEERSCYNCRFRRWTQTSFVCMKAGSDS